MVSSPGADRLDAVRQRLAQARSHLGLAPDPFYDIPTYRPTGAQPFDSPAPAPKKKNAKPGENPYPKDSIEYKKFQLAKMREKLKVAETKQAGIFGDIGEGGGFDFGDAFDAVKKVGGLAIEQAFGPSRQVQAIIGATGEELGNASRNIIYGEDNDVSLGNYLERAGLTPETQQALPILKRVYDPDGESEGEPRAYSPAVDVTQHLARNGVPIPVAIATGLTLDIATDPVSYLAPEAKLPRTEEAISQLRKLKEVAEAAGDLEKAARYGEDIATVGKYRTLASVSTESLNDMGFKGGIYVNKPFTGHIAQNVSRLIPGVKKPQLEQFLIVNRDAALGTALRKVPQRTGQFYAWTRETKLGAGLLQRFGGREEYARLRAMQASGDPEKAWHAVETLYSDRLARGVARAGEISDATTWRTLADEVKHVDGAVVAEALRGEPKAAAFVEEAAPGFIERFKSYVEDVRTAANERAGTDAIHFVEGYVPRVLSEGMRANLRKLAKRLGSAGGRFGPSDLEIKRSYFVGDEFLGEVLLHPSEAGMSIEQQMERIAGARADELRELGKDVRIGATYAEAGIKPPKGVAATEQIPWFEHDINKIMPRYIERVADTVYRRRVETELVNRHVADQKWRQEQIRAGIEEIGRELAEPIQDAELAETFARNAETALDDATERLKDAVSRGDRDAIQLATIEQQHLSDAVKHYGAAQALDQEGKFAAAQVAMLHGEAAMANAHLAQEGKALHFRINLTDDNNFQVDFVPILRDGFKRFGPGTSAPEHIVEAMTTMARKLATDEDVHALSRAWGKFTGWFKAWALSTPGTQFRNLFGGWFNNWLAGIDTGAYHWYDRGRREYAAWLKNGQKGELSDAGSQFKQVLDAGMHTGGQTAFEVERTTVEGARSLKPWSPNFVVPRAVRQGVDVGAVHIPGAVNTENLLRGALAMDTLKNGGTIDDALARVSKFHFDYEDLSRVETQVRKFVIPFYTWTRKNVPLQVEMLLKQPVKYHRYLQVKQAVEATSNPDELVPGYLHEQGGIRLPLGSEGSHQYITPDLPMRDLFRITDPGQATSMLHPIPKLALERFAGRSTFTDVPFRPGYQKVPGFYEKIPGLMPALSALNQTAVQGADGHWYMHDSDLYTLDGLLPPMSQARRLLSDEQKYQERRLATMLSFGFGLGVKTNDTETQKQLLDSQIRDAQARASTLRSLGYITDEEQARKDAVNPDLPYEERQAIIEQLRRQFGNG